MGLLSYTLTTSISAQGRFLPQGVVTIIFVLFVTGVCVSVRYRRGLKQIPGPFLASLSPLDRLRTAASGQQFRKHLAYHQIYGPLVRVGPRHVSFSNAALIPLVYGITSRFYKSDFYTLFDVKNSQSRIVSTVFSVRDEKKHKSLKRPVANAYSMGTLVELEPMTDACIEILERKFHGFQGESLDLGTWLQWYAFDVITSITFSNRLGFMEQERDISGVIDAIEGRLAYNCVVGEMPVLHKWLLGNKLISRIASWIPSLARLNSSRYIVQFAQKQLERYSKTDKATDALKDMLARFKRSRDQEEVMSDDDLLSHATSNIFAGSDTTAISLRSMFYYLCKNRHCYDKLVAEIDGMDKRGQLSAIVSFGQANKMSYLQACMKEAMRMHPAVGQLLERVVPEGGFDIAPGIFLPQGTIVGMNPWIPSREKSVYGPDVDQFRPERWLEADAESLKLMDRNFLAFGSGARTCLGKNISLLEMSKLVPQLLRNFDIHLSKPDEEWVLTDHWFVKQSNLLCRLVPRPKIMGISAALDL